MSEDNASRGVKRPSEATQQSRYSQQVHLDVGQSARPQTTSPSSAKGGSSHHSTDGGQGGVPTGSTFSGFSGLDESDGETFGTPARKANPTPGSANSEVNELLQQILEGEGKERADAFTEAWRREVARTLDITIKKYDELDLTTCGVHKSTMPCPDGPTNPHASECTEASYNRRSRIFLGAISSHVAQETDLTDTTVNAAVSLASMLAFDEKQGNDKDFSKTVSKHCNHHEQGVTPPTDFDPRDPSSARIKDWMSTDDYTQLAIARSLEDTGGAPFDEDDPFAIAVQMSLQDQQNQPNPFGEGRA